MNAIPKHPWINSKLPEPPQKIEEEPKDIEIKTKCFWAKHYGGRGLDDKISKRETNEIGNTYIKEFKDLKEIAKNLKPESEEDIRLKILTYDEDYFGIKRMGSLKTITPLDNDPRTEDALTLNFLRDSVTEYKITFKEKDGFLKRDEQQFIPMCPDGTIPTCLVIDMKTGEIVDKWNPNPLDQK